jgi:hypothetical protein
MPDTAQTPRKTTVDGKRYEVTDVADPDGWLIKRDGQTFVFATQRGSTWIGNAESGPVDPKLIERIVIGAH